MATAIGKTTVSVLLPRPGFIGWACRLFDMDYGWIWKDISDDAQAIGGKSFVLGWYDEETK